MHKTVTLLVLLVAMAGCGRKEPPQVTDPRQPPELASLTYKISGNLLRLELKLAGGAEGLGFQVDRAEQDPGCKCPGFWRRYFEAPPTPRQKEGLIRKSFNLRTHKHAYYFRVRAIDDLGRLGPWSKRIFAQAEDMPE